MEGRGKNRASMAGLSSTGLLELPRFFFACRTRPQPHTLCVSIGPPKNELACNLVGCRYGRKIKQWKAARAKRADRAQREREKTG